MDRSFSCEIRLYFSQLRHNIFALTQRNTYTIVATLHHCSLQNHNPMERYTLSYNKLLGYEEPIGSKGSELKSQNMWVVYHKYYSETEKTNKYATKYLYSILYISSSSCQSHTCTYHLFCSLFIQFESPVNLSQLWHQKVCTCTHDTLTCMHTLHVQ